MTTRPGEDEPPMPDRTCIGMEDGLAEDDPDDCLSKPRPLED